MISDAQLRRSQTWKSSNGNSVNAEPFVMYPVHVNIPKLAVQTFPSALQTRRMSSLHCVMASAASRGAYITCDYYTDSSD